MMSETEILFNCPQTLTFCRESVCVRNVVNVESLCISKSWNTFKSVSVKEIEEIICINIGCLGRAVTGEIEGGSRYISSPQQLWLSCGLAADQERRAVSSHHVYTAVTCTEQQHTSGRSRSSCYEFHPALKTSAADDPQSVSHNYHKGWVALRHYANQLCRPLWLLRWWPNFTSTYCGVNACLA